MVKGLDVQEFLAITRMAYECVQNGRSDEALLHLGILEAKLVQAAGVEASSTKDGVLVKAGQVWRDLDKRMGNRHCKVDAVRDGKAVMFPCLPDGRILRSARSTTVSVSRMHKGSTGWELVLDFQI